MKIQEVQMVVAKFYGMTREELAKPGREQPRATIRLVGMALAAEHTELKTGEVAQWFGCLSPSSVEYAERKVAEMLQVDELLAAEWRVLSSALRERKATASRSIWVRVWRAARNFSKRGRAAGQKLVMCDCGKLYGPKNCCGCPDCRRLTASSQVRSWAKKPDYVPAEAAPRWYGPDIFTHEDGVPGFGSLKVLAGMLSAAGQTEKVA